MRSHFARWTIICLLMCVVLPSASFGEPAEDVAKARALLEQGKPAEAFDLLQQSGDEDRLGSDPAYTLVFADAAWRHAPSQPAMVPNGGDRQREFYIGAADLYRAVMTMPTASDKQKKYAKNAIQGMLDALADRGDQAWEKDDISETVRLAEIMAGVEPDSSEGPMVIFQIGQETNDFKLQLHALRLLIKTKPKDHNAYILAATLEAEPDVGLGKKAALAHIDKGIAILPNNMSLMHERARWLVELQRTDEALKATADLEKLVTETVKDKQESAIIVASIGMFYEQLGQPDQAIRRYEQALDAKPDLLRARYALGALHFKQGVDALLQIPDLPRDKQAEINALRTAATKSFTTAMPHLETYHQHIDPPDLGVMQTLQEIYQQLGEIKKLKQITADLKKAQRGEPIR